MSYSLDPRALLGDDVPLDTITDAVLDLHQREQKAAKHRDLQSKIAGRVRRPRRR